MVEHQLPKLRAVGSIPITRSNSRSSRRGPSPLDINLTSFPQSASAAAGALVAIDVFRAFTTAAYAFASGASEIVMVKELDEALELKEAGRVDLTVGERHGLKPDGFDFGNSPTAMDGMDLSGARIAQTTTNGTACLASATDAKSLYAAALVNARATGKAVRKAAEVNIVAAGRNGDVRADEDELCALYIRSVASNETHDAAALQRLVQRWFGNDDFLRSRERLGPHTDWLFALDVDRFDFAIKVKREMGLLVARQD